MDDIRDFRLERLFQAYKDGDGYVTLASFTDHVAGWRRCGAGRATTRATSPSSTT